MDFDAYQAAMIASMKSRTGKTLDEWLALIGPQLPAERKGRLQWLKQRFDLKQNSAYLILSHLDEMDGTSLYAHGDALLNDLFEGHDEALHGLYDRLLARVGSFGNDVRVLPRKHYVALSRGSHFALLRPVRNQLAIALALPANTQHPLLQPARGFGDVQKFPWQLRLDAQQLLTDDMVQLLHQAYVHSA
jgi:predicted transport protein